MASSDLYTNFRRKPLCLTDYCVPHSSTLPVAMKKERQNSTNRNNHYPMSWVGDFHILYWVNVHWEGILLGQCNFQSSPVCTNRTIHGACYKFVYNSPNNTDPNKCFTIVLSNFLGVSISSKYNIQFLIRREWAEAFPVNTFRLSCWAQSTWSWNMGYTNHINNTNPILWISKKCWPKRI